MKGPLTHFGERLNRPGFYSYVSYILPNTPTACISFGLPHAPDDKKLLDTLN